MNRRLFITGGVIIGILALVGVWKFLGQEKAGDATKQQKPLPMVAAQEVKTMAISRTVELTGSVTATQLARLASPGEGPVQNCRVREGDEVKRGQRLITIGRSGAAAAQVTAVGGVPEGAGSRAEPGKNPGAERRHPGLPAGHRPG